PQREPSSQAPRFAGDAHVQLAMLGNHRLPAKAERRLARSTTHLPPEVRVRGELIQSLRDNARLLADQEAALPVGEELPDAVHRSCEDRQAARSGLERDQRESLVAGGKDKRISQLVYELHV